MASIYHLVLYAEQNIERIYNTILNFCFCYRENYKQGWFLNLKEGMEERKQ